MSPAARCSPARSRRPRWATCSSRPGRPASWPPWTTCATSPTPRSSPSTSSLPRDVSMHELSKLVVETPSWGYADSGTRFGVFPQPGRPRDVSEKLEDAAEVHRLTGTAGAVALHFPWDEVEDYGALRREIEARGLRVGAVN